MVFLFLLIIPLLIATIAFLVFNKQIVWWEFLIQVAAQVVIAGVCFAVAIGIILFAALVASVVFFPRK